MSYTDPASILVPVAGSLVPHQLLDTYNTNDEYFYGQLQALIANLEQFGIHGRLHLVGTWTTAGSFTETALPMDTQDWAAGITVSSGTFIVATPGYYKVTGVVGAAGTATGQEIRAAIQQNGGSVNTGYGDQSNSSAAQVIASTVTDTLSCAVNDVINLAYICSTAGLNGQHSSSTAYLTVDYIGPT